MALSEEVFRKHQLHICKNLYYFTSGKTTLKKTKTKKAFLGDLNPKILPELAGSFNTRSCVICFLEQLYLFLPSEMGFSSPMNL